MDGPTKNGYQTDLALGPRSNDSKHCTENGGTISLTGQRSNISKLGTEDGRNNNWKKRSELFGERCKVCRNRTLNVDDMSIIIKTTKQTALRPVIKIDFLIME